MRLAAWLEQCRASYEGSNEMLLYKTPAIDAVVKRSVPMHRSDIIDLYSSLLVALKKYVANLRIIGISLEANFVVSLSGFIQSIYRSSSGFLSFHAIETSLHVFNCGLSSIFQWHMRLKRSRVSNGLRG